MAAAPYDIKFTIASGASAGTYGFMLVSPKGESKQLQSAEVPLPDAQRVTAEAAVTHQDFDPRVDTPFAQESWTGGAGQLTYDDGDEYGYLWGSGVVTHVDGKAYLAPPAQGPLALTSATGDIAGFYTYYHNATTTRYDFCWEGPRLYRRPGTDATTAWTLVYTAAFDISSFIVFNGAGLIATPSSTSGTVDFLSQADVTAAATWTPTERNHTVFSSGTKPKYLLGVRGTCFAVVDNQKVFYTMDPAQDAWLGPLQLTVGSVTAPEVGDSTYPFTGILAVNDYLFCFKQSAGYSIDSQQNVTEVLWQWKERPGPLNFRFIVGGGDLLFYTIGTEVYSYDPGTGVNLPMRLARRDAFSIKEILGLASDNQFAYVLARVRVPVIRSAESVALLRLHRQGSRWYPEVLWEDTALTGKTYFRLGAVPTSEGSRLYWGKTESSATTTYVMDIPPDWDESSGSSFATSGVLYTSITRGRFPGFVKRHLWLGTEGLSVSGTNTIVPAYTLNDGSTYTALATMSASPYSAEYSDVNGRTFGLKFTLAGNGTGTPVLRVFDHHQRVRFRYLPSITAAVRLADNIERLNNSRDKDRTAATLLADLETLRTTDAKITYEDYTGESFTATVDVVTFKPTRHEGADKFELEATVLINRADQGA